MGAMKEFVMWCEEKGYVEWNDREESYEYTDGRATNELMSEWINEPKTENDNGSL